MEKNTRTIIFFVLLSIALFLTGYFIGGATSGNKKPVRQLDDTVRQLDIVTAGFAEYRRQSEIIYQQFRDDIKKLEFEFGSGTEIIRDLREKLGSSQDALRKIKESNSRIEKIIFGKSD